MRQKQVNLTKDQISNFCERNYIRKFALYGSILTDDFRADSDVDVLVEFEPDQPIGLMAVARIERELSELVGRQVDLRTPQDLSKYFRDKVVSEAEVLYERN